MEEYVVNNVKILYALGFSIMNGNNAKTQNRATHDIIKMFENYPSPVSACYMFENENDNTYVMVEFMRNGTCVMRIPTANEMTEYLDDKLKEAI